MTYLMGNFVFAAAAIAGIFLTIKTAGRYGIQKKAVLKFLVIAVLAAAVCARIYWILVNFQSFLSDPLNSIWNWNGNVSLYGALIGLLVAAGVVSRTESIALPTLLDVVSPGAVLAVAVGRTADYFFGSCFGSVVQTQAFRFFPVAVYATDLNSWLYAVFFYEAAFCLGVFCFLQWFSGKASRSGDVFLWLMLFYGCGRTVFESMRADSVFIGFVKPDQVASMAIVLWVLISFCKRALKARRFRISDIFYWVFGGLSVAAAYWAEYYMGAQSYARNTLILAAAMSLLLLICVRFYSVRTKKTAMY